MSTERDSVIEDWETLNMPEMDGGLLMSFLEEPQAEVAAEDDELGHVMQSLEAEISDVNPTPDNPDVMILASSSSISTLGVLQDSVMEDIFEGVAGDGCSLNWEGSGHEMEVWYADACMDEGDMIDYGEYSLENYSPLW